MLLFDIILGLMSQKESERLLLRFKSTQEYIGMLSEASKSIVDGHKRGFGEFFRSFSGAVFQSIAFDYLRARDVGVVYDPEATLKFFQELYPQNQEIIHSFGLDSLHGISVPDAISLDRHDGREMVKTVYECTYGSLSKSFQEKYFQKKIHGFQIQKSKFPEIFSKSRLCFVVPSETKIPSPIKKDGRVDIMRLPFVRSRFVQYMGQLYKSVNET